MPIGFVATENPDGTLVTLPPGSPPNPRTNALTQKTFNEVTFRAALRQDLGEKANIYASVNRGFKSGQFNLQSPFDVPVTPVTIMAYEAGVKAELLDNRLRLNIAGFHYDIKDYQIRTSAGNPPVSALFNAAKVKIDGVDVNLEAAVSSQFRLTAGMSYLDSRYSEFGGPVHRRYCAGLLSAAVPAMLPATGRRCRPKFTFNARPT